MNQTKQYTDSTLPISKRVWIQKQAERCINIYSKSEVFIRKHGNGFEIVMSWRKENAWHANVLDSDSFAALQASVRKIFPNVGTLWCGFKGQDFQIWGAI